MEKPEIIIAKNADDAALMEGVMRQAKVAVREERTAQLYAALAKAQAALRGVEKDGKYSAKMKDSNFKVEYNYASAEAVMQAATESMAVAGLALICTTWGLNGKYLQASYLLTHGDGGSMSLGPYMMSIHENKMKPTDKAIATGLTYLQNYATRGIFNIPRVEPGTERDSQHDADIQAWESEQQKARKKREKDEREEHAARKKLLLAKKTRIKTGCEEFFRASNCKRDQETMRAFICYAAATDEYPTEYDDEIAALDETMTFLIGWQSDETVEAEKMAHEFGIVINGTLSLDKKAEDAFEASLEGKA